MLEPYMALALAGRMLALTVFGAIFIIIQFQLRQDALSRALLNLVVIFAANTGLSLVVRFMSLAGQDITLLFNCIIVLVGAIPGMVFMFVVTYCDIWTPIHRRIALLFMVYLLLDGLLSGLHALSANVRILPDGILEFDRLPLANLMVGLGQVGLFVSLGVLWMQYRKRRRQGGQWNNGVLVGVLILVLAGMTIAFPALTRYTTEQFLYAFGAVALVRPVLRQRLFDPLAKLNASLAHRAEQFAIITRVSQQANAHLNLPALLDAVVQRIHDAFGYYAVSIYLPEADHLLVHAAAGVSAAAFVKSGHRLPLETVRDALTYHEDLSEVQGHSPHPLRPASRSLVRIPLWAAASDDPAAEQRLVGLLDIQSEWAAAFGPDDREVFAILANQIAIAIRNAELFEQIQQSNRYKTRFIHTISHELRTPLQTVTGNLDFLPLAYMYPGTVLTEGYLKDVAMIQHAAQHLENLLDNILDLGKIESGETELVIQPVDPVPLLAEMEETFGGSVKPGVALLHHYPSGLPPVQADNLRLKQILTNLLSNACKFTVEGQISLDVHVEETQLVISVTDTGPGIAPEVRPRLFTSFVQGSRFISRDFGGTGLGLSISRHLARLMGGDVWFESTVGQGSTFYCALPLAETTGHAAESDGIPPRAARLEKPDTVPALALVVGLELDRQAYMEDAFDVQASYRVISTADPTQAVRIAAAARPQVIVCIHPDGVSTFGVEALRQNPVLADIPIRSANGSTWPTVLMQALAEVLLTSEALRSKTMSSYPPGPASSRLELLKFAKNPLAYFQELAATYGSFAYVRLSTRDTYLISSPEALHAVLVEQADRFEKPTHTRDSISTFMGEGLIALSGPKHKQHRRMIQPTLSHSRVERYGPVMVEYARRMVETWQVGETRDIAADLMRLALNVVGTTVFGVPNLAENHALFEATTVAQRYSNDTLIHGKAVSVSDAERQRALDLLDALVADVLKPRQTSDHDLIALLKNAADPESGQRLTDQEIRDEALTLLLAGHETTANALAWTFYLLAKHPGEEARLGAEIDRVVGMRAAAITDLPNLPYTDRVIQESLRLYPPAWFFGRTPFEPVEVLGYTILPGANIVVSPYVIHRNPEHFPEPETFNPDRFISEPPRYAYLPFGLGPRMCVGQSLALQEMALVLATVLQRVRLSVPEAYLAEPEPMLTLRPRNGLKMTVSSRKVGEQVS